MRLAASLFLLALLAGCAAPAWKLAPHDLRFQRERPPRLHAAPAEGDFSLWWDIFWLTGTRPLAEAISPGLQLRRLGGGTPALDVNAFGEVPDSTWFENRIGRAPMSPDEIRRGPDTVGGPAAGKLLVEQSYKLGVVPRLLVRDTRGTRWVIKFEHPVFPEMSSAAEIISTKLLHAAGYFVPENYLAFLDPTRLEMSPRAVARYGYGGKTAFDSNALRGALAHLPRRPDGALRVIFSRFLAGRPIGPSSNFGVRSDDPNDTIPHERRRSRRGLWLFAAWLNHSDMKQQQTLDMFISEPGQKLGYLRHYLIDFGSTLGSGESIAKPPDAGFEYFLDWPVLLANLATLGLYYRPWLEVKKSPFRAVGIFEAEQFDPASWRPLFPLPAFERATALDIYWAAAILARLTPELVAAAVEAGRYSEAGAAAWVLRVLLERRVKLLRFAFRKVLALDDPRVVQGYRLELTDLETGLHLVDARSCSYHWSARWDRSPRRSRSIGEGRDVRPVADLQHLIDELRRTDGAAFNKDPFITLRWQRRCGAGRPPLEVHLRALPDRLLLVGLSRAARF